MHLPNPDTLPDEPNGRPAVATIAWRAGAGVFALFGVDTITMQAAHTGMLPQNPIMSVGFPAAVLLVIGMAVAGVVYLRNRPRPTKAEVAAQALAEAEELIAYANGLTPQRSAVAEVTSPFLPLVSAASPRALPGGAEAA